MNRYICRSANSEECLFKLWEFAYADLVYNYPPPTSTQSKNGRTWITGSHILSNFTSCTRELSGLSCLFLYITTLDFVFLKAAP
ncbi:hypothetical protein AAMO2058_001346500 [Amorphochlora amoebiformis]